MKSLCVLRHAAPPADKSGIALEEEDAASTGEQRNVTAAAMYAARRIVKTHLHMLKRFVFGVS
jgi:hypothetical protein